MVSTYAVATTKNEVEDGYRNLRRHLDGTQPAYAVTAALGLAKIDAIELWQFIKSYGTTATNYRETSHLLVLDALYNSWVQDPTNSAFIAQAIATLANLSKVNGESVLKFFHNHKC